MPQDVEKAVSRLHVEGHVHQAVMENLDMCGAVPPDCAMHQTGLRMPCRAGYRGASNQTWRGDYRAAWDTVLCGIRWRVGYCDAMSPVLQPSGARRCCQTCNIRPKRLSLAWRLAAGVRVRCGVGSAHAVWHAPITGHRFLEPSPSIGVLLKQFRQVSTVSTVQYRT